MTEDRMDAAIDASLKRRFAPPDLDGVVARLERRTRPPSRWRGLGGRRAVAAAVVIVVGLAWSVWGRGGGRGTEIEAPPRDSLAALGIARVEPIPEGSPIGCAWVNEWEITSQQPSWVVDPPIALCESQSFKEPQLDVLECAIDAPRGLKTTLPERDPFDPKQIKFSSLVEGRLVMVYVRRTEGIVVPAPPSGTPVRCWSRPLGPLVVYEVSRLDGPRILQLLEPPEL